MPGEGPRGAARLLRLSGRALGSHPHDQPHRVHVRDGAAAHEQDQRVRLALGELTMVFKLCQSAEKSWRALNGSKLIADLIAGVKFVDGLRAAA